MRAARGCFINLTKLRAELVTKPATPEIKTPRLRGFAATGATLRENNEAALPSQFFP